jgi:hypothetical protein
MQDIISHVVSSHLDVRQQGITGVAQTMHRLQMAYATWRDSLAMTRQLSSSSIDLSYMHR